MGSPTKEQIIDALRSVNDPARRQDLVALDMIKSVAVCDGNVKVNVALASPDGRATDPIRRDVEAAIRSLDDVNQVEVEFVPQVGGETAEPSNDPAIKNIVAIGAGKGGVGKSTVAVLTAVGLRRTGAKVGLLDADVYGPSIPKMMGIEGAKPIVDGDRILPIEAYGVKIMSIGFMVEPDRAVVWRGPMVHGVIKQFLGQVAWGDLDYLIVDLPPGTGDVPLTLSQSIPMTGAVVVCTPQDVALLDAVRAAKMYQQLNVDILGIVENMSYFVAPDTGTEYDLFGRGGAERAAGDLRVPFLGAVPINIALRVAGDDGTPESIFTDGQQGLSEAVTGMVDALANEIAVRNANRGPAAKLNVVRCSPRGEGSPVPLNRGPR